MTNEQLIERFQEKIIELNKKAQDGLNRLNKRSHKKYKHITSMYELDLEYYHEVARHAWALRATQIAMLEMQTMLNELKNDLLKP